MDDEAAVAKVKKALLVLKIPIIGLELATKIGSIASLEKALDN